MYGMHLLHGCGAAGKADPAPLFPLLNRFIQNRASWWPGTGWTSAPGKVPLDKGSWGRVQLV